MPKIFILTAPFGEIGHEPLKFLEETGGILKLIPWKEK